MLELVEGGVVVLVDAEEFLLQSLQLVLILRVLADQLLQLLLELRQICRTTINILLSLKQEDFLLLVVRLHLLRHGVLSIFEHLD